MNLEMMIKNLTVFLSALLLISCGPERVVVWESLTALDNLSIKIENAAYEHEHGKQKELLLEAKGLIPKVVSSIPENAKNKEQVDALLKDLSALTTELEKMETLDHGQLDALSKSIHPIVAKVMVTAGVPHIHAVEEGHDPATCTDPTHNH